MFETSFSNKTKKFLTNTINFKIKKQNYKNQICTEFYTNAYLLVKNQPKTLQNRLVLKFN